MNGKRITRERFFSIIAANEDAIRTQIKELLDSLQSCADLVCKVGRAEDTGLKVTFFETETGFYFTAEEKGEIGFIHPQEVSDGRSDEIQG